MSKITGAHAIIYSTNSTEDRKFFRDILKLTSVDVGDGWLIFGLPPSEVAIHPGSSNDEHELYLLCDDIDGFAKAMKEKKINCSPIQNMGWGMLSQLTLPGGGKIGVYQPRHKRPKPMQLKAKASVKKKPLRKKAVKVKTKIKPKRK